MKKKGYVSFEMIDGRLLTYGPFYTVESMDEFIASIDFNNWAYIEYVYRSPIE